MMIFDGVGMIFSKKKKEKVEDECKVEVPRREVRYKQTPHEIVGTKYNKIYQTECPFKPGAMIGSDWCSGGCGKWRSSYNETKSLANGDECTIMYVRCELQLSKHNGYDYTEDVEQMEADLARMEKMTDQQARVMMGLRSRIHQLKSEEMV